jgi:hypothetical protein
MGKLHDQMQEDLRFKAYSPNTQGSYLRCARHFAKHYMRSPEEMGEQAVRDFLLYPVRDRQSSPASTLTLTAKGPPGGSMAPGAASARICHLPNFKALDAGKPPGYM